MTKIVLHSVSGQRIPQSRFQGSGMSPSYRLSQSLANKHSKVRISLLLGLVVMHSFNPSTPGGGSRWISTEFKATLVYLVTFRPAGTTGRPYLKQTKKPKKTKNKKRKEKRRKKKLSLQMSANVSRKASYLFCQRYRKHRSLCGACNNLSQATDTC